MTTWAILGNGPSLTADDVDVCRGRVFVMAIKDTVRLAPWADVLYGCDAKWWRHYGDACGFDGPRYALEQGAAKWATVLKNTGDAGLEIDHKGLRTGRNSGYQAINLAVHLGATRIVLLGYDMQPKDGNDHWWTESRPASYWTKPSPYDVFLRLFDTIVEPLKALGVVVLNATPGSALRCFPMVSLSEALRCEVAA